MRFTEWKIDDARDRRRRDETYLQVRRWTFVDQKPNARLVKASSLGKAPEWKRGKARFYGSFKRRFSSEYLIETDMFLAEALGMTRLLPNSSIIQKSPGWTDLQYSRFVTSINVNGKAYIMAERKTQEGTKILQKELLEMLNHTRGDVWGFRLMSARSKKRFVHNQWYPLGYRQSLELIVVSSRHLDALEVPYRIKISEEGSYASLALKDVGNSALFAMWLAKQGMVR